MKKRLLCMLLACLMVVTLIPATVFALEAEDAEHQCPGKDETHTLANCPDATVYDETHKNPASCGTGNDSWGYIVYKCPECGALFADSFTQSKEHTMVWEEGKEPKDPTCTEAGFTGTGKCSVCGFEQTGAEIPMTGHKLGKVVSGNCEDGKVVKLCETCGKEVEVQTDGRHIWGEPTIVEEPTCKDGVALFTCEMCGATKKDVPIINHGEHKLVEHKLKEATCEEDGTVAYWECTVCGKLFTSADAKEELRKDASGKYETVIPALGHKPGKWVKVKEATCSETGLKETNCKTCGKKLTQEIEKKAHKWNVKSKEPTCTTWGYEGYSCKVCGYTTDITPIPPLGHVSWDDKSVTDAQIQNPTCTQDGSVTWTCTRCQKQQTETLPAYGHNEKTFVIEASCKRHTVTITYCANPNCDTYKKETNFIDKDNGKEYDLDTPLQIIEIKCDGKIDPSKHYIKEGNIKLATCTEDGFKVGYCADCSEYFTEYLPALGHDFDASIKDNVTEIPVANKERCDVEVRARVKCSRDGCDAEEVIVVKEAKAHKYGKATVVAPTCVAQGYTTETCDVCKYEHKFDYVKFTPKDVYTSVEEAKAAHNNNIELVEEFRKGDCEILGLLKYKCSSCEAEFLVEEEGTGDHVWKKTPGKAPTCTEPGYNEKWECTRCGAVDKDHDGKTIPALNHDGKELLIDSRKADCENFGYEHYYCPLCKKDYVDNYVPALGHDLEVDTPEIAATCEHDGQTAIKKCKRDGCDYRTGGEKIAQLPHKNQKGEVLVNDCLDKPTDRKCVNGCNKEIGKDHPVDSVVLVSVPATCGYEGYNLTVCMKCGTTIAEEIVPKNLNNHVWGEWKLTTPPTYTTPAVYTRKCELCGKEEHKEGDKVTGLNFALDVTNADTPFVETPRFVDSSRIAVKVSVESIGEIPVWGINFDLKYDAEVLTYDGFEFAVGNKFVESSGAVNNVKKDAEGKVEEAYVSFVGSVPNDENKKAADIVVNGVEDVCIIYFRINSRDAKSTTLSFSKTDAVNTHCDLEKGELLGATSETATIKIEMILDSNSDGKINIADLLYVQKIINGENADVIYDVIVDADKNGKIDVNDLTALYNYMLGKLSYEDLVKLGVN